MMVRRVQPGSAVSVQLNYLAFNGFSGLWRSLPSSGALETAILNGIERKLEDIAPLVPGETAVAGSEARQTSATAERVLIRKFLLVGAAIDNSLPSDRRSEFFGRSSG